jgi:hypothetical protein
MLNVKIIEPTNNMMFFAVCQTSQNAEEGNLRNGSLAARLKLNPVRDRDFVPLPGPLLRKFIAYAKQFVFPRCSGLSTLSKFERLCNAQLYKNLVATMSQEIIGSFIYTIESLVGIIE